PTAEIHLLRRGGLHLWVRLPRHLDEETVVERAGRAGVLVSPGRIYYPAEPPGPRIRISHSAAANTAELAEGVRRLATAVEEV
ncbi:PLP-dependent aminotransferase family protein, partial [Streptosporangium algeriense]